MDKQLQIISQEELQRVDPGEIDRVIAEIVEASRDNHQEIANLTLESVSLLTAAQTRSRALAEQKTLKRLWNNVTGKNDRLRNAIAQDTSVAQYAAQQAINRVLAECSNNQKLALAVNNRLSGLVRELEATQEQLSGDVERARKMIVALYQDYEKKFQKQKEQIDDLHGALGERCLHCGQPLKSEQIVCPGCGEIHAVKGRNLPVDIQEELKFLSDIIKRDHWDTGVAWSEAADRYAAALLKTSEIASKGNLTLSKELEKDIGNLIEKCRSAEFQIAVVGVLKAGKSMLMNALIGIDLASTGLNSETAALTKFRSSSMGHYVQVTFYSKMEWDKLNASAQKSVQDGQSGDESLKKLLSNPKVKEEAKKWIGHAPVQEKCRSIDKLRERVQHWTSAKSDAHLFAAEVEVGIGENRFQMPKEVVFVDTPGLKDPVEYRAKITEVYIGRANAVLVTVPPRALTKEGFETITFVLDHAGSDKKKVYIIGTQKDTLKKITDYDDLINGRGGWVTQLSRTRRYRDERETAAQILTTSAYLQFCMDKALSLSTQELIDDDKFSPDEYTDLQRGIAKALGLRSYALENLKGDAEAQQKAERFFGIKLLKKRLENDLISRFRLLKIKDIQEDYIHCKQELLDTAQESVIDQKELVSKTRLGAEALRKQLLEKQEERDRLKEEQKKMSKALEDLRKFTDQRFG